jgi:hypothetical protein
MLNPWGVLSQKLPAGLTISFWLKDHSLSTAWVNRVRPAPRAARSANSPKALDGAGQEQI